MLHTTLMRLAGVPSQQKDANKQAYDYHLAMLQAVKQSSQTGMSFIFDRSYLCERVYAKLGYKSHSFEEEVEKLNSELAHLTSNYEVDFVLLTASKEVLESRLNRGDKPQFEAVMFHCENSLKQQQAYQEEFLNLPKHVFIQVLNTDQLTPKEIVERIIKREKEE